MALDIDTDKIWMFVTRTDVLLGGAAVLAGLLYARSRSAAAAKAKAKADPPPLPPQQPHRSVAAEAPGNGAPVYTGLRGARAAAATAAAAAAAAV